jgi:hypothetical protein
VSYEDRAKVQIGAELLCKGGKERVEYWIEYRVRITDFKGMRQGRGFAAPFYGGSQGGALPLPASGARERGERNAAGRRAQAAEGRSTIRRG